MAKRDGRGRVYVAESGVDAVAEPAPASAAGRRRLRDGVGTPVRGLVHRVLDALDGPLAQAPPSDRLEAVAGAFADAFDAGSWAVSQHVRGEDVVRTLFEGGRRTHRVSGVPSLRFRSDSDTYPLGAYPATAAILAANGGAFCTLAGDPDGDPSEQALLAVAGYRSVTAAAARAEGDGWLVELFADRRSGPLEAALGELRLLTAEAVRNRA